MFAMVPAPPETAATRPACASSGSASEAVAVQGKFGTAPKVKFDAPLTTKSTQRSTIIKGTGPTVKQGDALTIGLVGYDARTGKQLTGSAYGTASVAVDASRYIPGLARSLDCTRVGERFTSVVPASEA